MQLTLVTILGLLLRIYFLNQHDFWFDEAFTYQISKLQLGDLLAVSIYDNNPPLYYLIIHFLLKASNNELFLRIPSLFFGLATIPAIFILAKKITSQKVAIIASLLMAVSPLSIYYSTETRMYALATLLIVITVLCFIRLLDSHQWFKYLIFSLFFILTFYTQIYALLLLIPFTFLILAKRGVHRKKVFFASLLLITAVTLPWMLTFVIFSHSGCGVCPNTILALPATVVAPAISGLGIVSMRQFINLPLNISASLAVAGGLTIFIFIRGLTKFELSTKIYLPIILTLSLAGIFWPIFSPRAATIFSPLFFIIAASGLDFVKRVSHHILPVLLIISLLSIVFIQKEVAVFKGEPLKQIALVLSAEAKPHNVIVHTSLVTYYSLDYYLPQFKHLLLTDNPLPREILAKISGEPTRLSNTSADTIWLVDTAKWNQRVEIESLRNNILSNFMPEKKISVQSISLEKLTRK